MKDLAPGAQLLTPGGMDGRNFVFDQTVDNLAGRAKSAGLSPITDEHEYVAAAFV